MKKIILSILIAWCGINTLCSQSLLIECWYNVNGYAHQALISLNGSSGRCHVISDNGDCWYSVYYNRHDTYTAISMSNPSKENWVPGTFYFVQGGNDYVVFQGYKFPVRASIVQEQYWSVKLNQYGFSGSSPSFRGKPSRTGHCYDCGLNHYGHYVCPHFTPRTLGDATTCKCGHAIGRHAYSN